MKKLINLFVFIFVLQVVTIFAQPGVVPVPKYRGNRAADPATCLATRGEWYYNTATAKFRYCSAANVFSDIGGGGITTGTTTSNGTANVVLKTNATGQVANSSITDDATTVATALPIVGKGTFSTTSPSYQFSGQANTGITTSAADVYIVSGSSTFKVGVNASEITAPGTWKIGWAAADPSGGSADTAFGRVSAAVIKSTNGGTTITSLIGGGAAIASAAAMPVPVAYLYHVTGTTNITSITSTNLGSGVCIVWIFDGILTVTDNGTTLNTAGNFVTAANSTMSLCYDGTNWREIARSAN